MCHRFYRRLHAAYLYGLCHYFLDFFRLLLWLGGALRVLGGALTHFSCKLGLKKNFSPRWGVQVHPLHPLATPMIVCYGTCTVHQVIRLCVCALVSIHVRVIIITVIPRL